MILQKSIPHNPLKPAKLPGIQPLDPALWLQPDDAFAGQMRRREELLAERRDKVLEMDGSAFEAAQELLETVLAQLYPDATEVVLRPDGQEVKINWQDPLGTLGRITQQDFCILQRPEGSDEHVLTGAILCFPASWTLAEKFMRPLIGIHDTVDSYDEGIAKRVQRLFDGVQTGRPLWRFNALWYHDPELHAPRRMSDPRDKSHGSAAQYMRSEQQVLLRLPKSRAVIFSIHSYVLHRDDVFAQWGEEA
ncbi:heme-dependent oxidative N-demethylase family protein [Roseobacter sp. SK209-2-6]|uniref:heme-dependent oxidative N-demethylase family protein n=1 Tax=Roseobacter sp. SK209-2-6 TaxID=388739 RepID=UPI00030532B5|nr:DUF3445 domain-containing protein [Roseobacter sp. SK209-2-6]